GMRALILSLEGPSGGAGQRGGRPPRVRSATRVRCRGCGREKIFDGLVVLIDSGTVLAGGNGQELIVEEGGRIKRGAFRCPGCGGGNVSIAEAGAGAGARAPEPPRAENGV